MHEPRKTCVPKLVAPNVHTKKRNEPNLWRATAQHSIIGCRHAETIECHNIFRQVSRLWSNRPRIRGHHAAAIHQPGHSFRIVSVQFSMDAGHWPGRGCGAHVHSRQVVVTLAKQERGRRCASALKPLVTHVHDAARRNTHSRTGQTDGAQRQTRHALCATNCSRSGPAGSC